MGIDVSQTYFHNVVSKLSFEDVALLTILIERSATSHFKSISNQTVFEASGLTEAKYRRTMNRLNALDFIVIVPAGKEHLLYLSEYGEAAITLFISETQEEEAI